MTWLAEALVMRTPLPVLPEMRFPPPASPMWLGAVHWLTRMPAAFGSEAVPAAVVPIRLPKILFPPWTTPRMLMPTLLLPDTRLPALDATLPAIGVGFGLGCPT